MKRNGTLKHIRNVLIMLLGSFLFAVGVYFFEMPNGFAIGGVTGIAIIIGHFLPIPTSILLLFLNVLLLVIGFIFIGKGTGGKTVFCSFAYSGGISFLEWLVPLKGTLTDQPFLELTCGILITGFAAAIIFYRGASTGGSEIIALIIKKYSSLNSGTALLFADLVVAVSSFFVFGVEIGMFSLLGLFAKSFLIDSVIENLSVCKSFMIITSNPKPIVEYILKTLDRSATTFDAVGGYTGEDRKIIMVICRRPEAAQLKQRIKELDPAAFITVQTTSEIIGKGFRSR